LAQAEVLSGYDGRIYLTSKQSQSSTFSITDNSTITIDNSDNTRELLKITITPSTTTNITFNSITDGVSTVTSSGITLTETDDLVLDFKNQVYTKNGTRVSDLTFGNKRIALQKDTSQDLTIDGSGYIDIIVEYEGYNTDEELSYVESFSLDYSVETSHKKGYKNNKIITTNFEGEQYDVNISKFTISERFLQGILDGRKHRVRFDVDNPATGDNMTHTLLDIVFESYGYGFTAPDEIMMEDIQGSAKDLIFNN
jgi:hypothetical protein